MAASMRIVCACSSKLLFKSVNNMRCYLICNRRSQLTSLTRRCLTGLAAHVVTTERRLSSIVTSACCASRTLKTFASASTSSCVRTTRSALDAARCSKPTLYSAFNGLFTFKRSSWQNGVIFHCRSLNSSNRTSSQTESKTAASEKPLPKLASEKPFPKFSSCCDDSDTRTNTSNGRPEKKENIRTIPNLLTTLRMASAPLLGYMVVCESFGPALGLFTLAGISDLLDGYIARNFPNQTSALGSALDPLADKLLVTILTITLTSVGLIPLPLTGLIVFRDISLIAGGFYIRYKSLPPPITLSRYFDISHATVSLAPTFISKLNTGLQLSLVACSLAAPVFGFVDHFGLQTLWWMTGATTFMSGADYMWSWRKYVTLLEKDQTEL